jgi:hypothetical protein
MEGGGGAGGAESRRSPSPTPAHGHQKEQAALHSTKPMSSKPHPHGCGARAEHVAQGGQIACSKVWAQVVQLGCRVQHNHGRGAGAWRTPTTPQRGNGAAQRCSQNTMAWGVTGGNGRNRTLEEEGGGGGVPPPSATTCKGTRCAGGTRGTGWPTEHRGRKIPLGGTLGDTDGQNVLGDNGVYLEHEKRPARKPHEAHTHGDTVMSGGRLGEGERGERSWAVWGRCARTGPRPPWVHVHAGQG